MLHSSGPTRLALALLVLVGACAGGASPPERVATPAPTEAPTGIDAPAVDAGVAHPPNDSIGDALRDVKPETGPARLSLAAFDGRAAATVEASRRAGAQIGYLVLDLDSGQTLAELNADLLLIPASTAKLATALVALDVLGPEHRFRTGLLMDGAVRGGVLEGDLILQGGGDPALDVADLLALAVRLRTSGVYRVDGRFLIDDTALPRLSEIELTQPPEAAYNPGIGALSLAFNRVRVAWRGGGALDVTTLPPLDRARFESVPPSLLPPGGVELARRGDHGVTWRVADRGRLRQEASLPVKDPGLHAGHVFRRLALAQGIALGPPQRAAEPPAARLLAAHESAPLHHLLRDMLVYSNNLMAELIGLSAAQRLGDVEPGLEAAGRLLVSRLAHLMPEVDWRGAVLANQSGLAGSARLTPRQLAAILRYGWRSDALPALLAAAGWSGTLSNRFDGPHEALRVWAKTGTLHYGSALAGYLFPEGAAPFAFVTMVSDIGARVAYDDALPHPPRRAEASARTWDARARTVQDELVKSWLMPLPTS